MIFSLKPIYIFLTIHFDYIQGVSLTVRPHFQYQNETNFLSQREALLHGKFLEKVVLVGYNLFFILVLKMGGDS